ncbi:hypothetical protein ACFLYT_00865 [Nanoarchaeota archaeon]
MTKGFTKKYVHKLNKLMQELLPQEDKRRNEKILAYIRIYTDLIHAGNLLRKDSYKKSIEFLKIVKRFTKEFYFKEEEAYLKRINELASSILSNIRCVRCRAKDCNVCNPAHARTKLQLAQNICVLRILKISS